MVSVRLCDDGPAAIDVQEPDHSRVLVCTSQPAVKSALGPGRPGQRPSPARSFVLNVTCLSENRHSAGRGISEIGLARADPQPAPPECHVDAVARIVQIIGRR